VKSQRRRKKDHYGKRFGRLHVFGIVLATLILGVSAVTVLSRQTGIAKESKPETASIVPNKPNKNYVTMKVAGQDVQVDSQTGDIQPLTPERLKS